MSILGSGIDAIDLDLSGQNNLNFSINEIKSIRIDLIDCGIYQPRKVHKISNQSINELVESVREYGILQPIILRCTPSKRFELIAGERRLKAATTLGFQEIPAILKKIDAQQAFGLALVENIQREQLSVLEEAEALLKLKNEFLMSTESVALMIGKPRTTIANLIRLASSLTPYGKDIFERGEVEYGHIRCVLTLPENIQNIILGYVLVKNLSVRATEKFVSSRAYETLEKIENQSNREEDILTHKELEKLLERVEKKHYSKIKFKSLRDGAFRVMMDFHDIKDFEKMWVD